MAGLAALGGLAGGLSQGINAGTQLRQRAVDLQRGQLELDNAKRALAAEAAAFAGLSGQPAPGAGGAMTMPGPMPQGPQPPMPGQASVPMAPPGQSPPAVPQQGAASQPQPPTGGAQLAPASAAPPGGGGAGDFSGQMDPSDPRAAVQTVMQIAREIKSRNPNIDPNTLFAATSRVIDLSKGLAPALRQGAQVILQDMRDKAAQQRVETQTGSREAIAGQTIESREKVAGQNIASREKVAAGHDSAALQRTLAAANGAMERAQFNQSQIASRVQSGQWSREKATAYREKMSAAQTKLRTAQQQLSSLQNTLVAADDPRVAAAQKRVEDAVSEIDRVNTAAGAGSAPAPSQAPSPSAAPAAAGGARPTATDAKGNKVEWNGQSWVPVAKGK